MESGDIVGNSAISRGTKIPESFRKTRCEGSSKEALFHNCAAIDIYEISDGEYPLVSI